MTMLDLTLPASFQGFPFLVKKMATIGGIKFVKQQFVNTKNQGIEVLGENERSYTFTIYLVNDSETDDYIKQKDKLTKILSNQIVGDLFHPLEGKISEMICTTWTINEEFTKLGKGSIIATFEKDSAAFVPIIAGNSGSQTVAKGVELKTDLRLSYVDKFLTQFGSDIIDTIPQVNDFVSSMRATTNSISQITKFELNSFTALVDSISSNVFSLISNPNDLMNSISNSISSIGGLFETVKAGFDSTIGLFNFGDDDVTIDISVSPLTIATTTAILIQRDSNRQLLRETIQTFALSSAFDLALTVPLTTIKEQDEISDLLDLQFNKIIEAKQIIGLNGIPIEIGISKESKELLTEQRTTLDNFFSERRIALDTVRPEQSIALTTVLSQQRITLKNIIEVYSFQTSARLLAYQYNGNSEQGIAIAKLNNQNDPSFIEGELEIITQ